ncbi:MAG: tetratricopeptide repeat protein [Bacteroidetes bacterium]|nr:tetratricopeptide repeat protein [Bacteroidota bacterium]
MKKVLLLFVAVCVSVVLFAQDAAEKINQANEALQGKDYAKAFALYEDAMSNLGDVQVPDAINYNIGLAAYNSKNFEKAITYFDKAIVAKANVAKAHDYKARSYNKLKDYANAVASYEAAIAGNEGDTKALVYNAAIAAYRAKLSGKAIAFFTQSVESGYKGETAQYYKAAVLKGDKKDDEYKAALEEAVAKFPGDKKMAPALAKIYVSEGNELYKKGAAVLGAANEKVNAGSLKTDDAAYIAEVAKAKVEFKAAIVVLEKAKALDATNANAQALLDACKAVL